MTKRQFPDLSISLFCPPKATTVLIADKTSSATDPAFAYAASSLFVYAVRTCKKANTAIPEPAREVSVSETNQEMDPPFLRSEYPIS